MPREALIVGLGLIGGSAGIALRRRGWRVRYLDPHVDLHDARNAGAADERVDAIGEADVILLATPVNVAIDFLRQTQTLTTSACSVMRPLRAVAKSNFIAGHPLAGSEARGLAAASATLFEGKPWFLDGEDERVEAMVHDCGGRIQRVDAEEHDAALALTSHLPQVLSTALAAYLADRPDITRFAGSGLKTFLRLAGSDADVWQPVIEANRDNLAPHAEALAKLVREMIESDPRDAFDKAQRFWRSLM